MYPCERKSSKLPRGLQELCKCEIPPHIGRVDFVKQMYRWADMTYTDGGLATFGKPNGNFGDK